MTRLAALALALAVAVAGCTSSMPIIVYDETPDASPPALGQPLPDYVVDGCDMLGLDCYAPDSFDTRGVVVLLVTPATGGAASGRELVDAACRKSAWVVEGVPLTVAHELGHLFGLEHVEAHGNVMHSVEAFAGDELTARQDDRLHRRASRFVAGCP